MKPLQNAIKSGATKAKKDYFIRHCLLAALFIVICLVYVSRLVNIQISGRDLYSLSAITTYSRTETIQALRGEVFDRNGVPLVTNNYSYELTIDYSSFPRTNAEKNTTLLKLYDGVLVTNNTDKIKTFNSPIAGTYPNYSFSQTLTQTEKNRYERTLKDLDFTDTKKYGEFSQILSALYKRYGLLDDKGHPLYTSSEIDLLLKMRFNMDMMRFSASEPYVVASNVDINCITYLKEQSLRGVDFPVTTSRKYEFPGYASHFLGQTGKIHEKDLAYYTEKGYSMDAVVGISGVEYAFEEYLRGIDGVVVIVEDNYGNVLDRYVKTEPIAGNNVWLTIDINMQIEAENALKENIEMISEKGKLTPDVLDGEDADAGALTAISTKGEVYAIASYPTYDLSTFNRDYNELAANPARPMINRALDGEYPPGSTFKMATAAAALAEGIITPKTKINDTGRYTFYPDFQPRCWIYLRYGIGHGHLDVTGALQVSCNYFFYEAGRLLTIEKLNEYCRTFGLGDLTGIELSETKGILASPEHSLSRGRVWNPGDTLQAAIGQSDNAFSPLQLSVYLATIVNGGTRYKAHILHSVREFYTDKIIYEANPQIISEAEMSNESLVTLMNAMKSVTENGSAARVFASYPIIVGGKTGTAQITTTKSDNAVFTAFAPFDNPEIVVTTVIEQGASGTDAGFAVRDIFDYYFGFNTVS